MPALVHSTRAVVAEHAEGAGAARYAAAAGPYAAGSSTAGVYAAAGSAAGLTVAATEAEDPTEYGETAAQAYTLRLSFPDHWTRPFVLPPSLTESGQHGMPRCGQRRQHLQRRERGRHFQAVLPRSH